MKILPLFAFLLISYGLYAVNLPTPIDIDKRLAELNIVFNKQGPDVFLKKTKEILTDSKKIAYSKGIAGASLRIALVLADSGDTEQAIQYFQMADNESYAKETKEFQDQLNFSFSLLYMQKKIYDLALEKLRKLPNKPELLYIAKCSSMGKCFSELKLPDSTIIYYKMAIEQAKVVKGDNVKSLLIDTYCKLAYFLMNKKQNDSVEHYLSEASKIARTANSNYSIYITTEAEGVYFLNIGKVDLAIMHLESALGFIKDSSSLYEIKDLYNNLYKAYKLKGDKSQSAYYFNLYRTVSANIKEGKNTSIVIDNLIKENQERSKSKKRKMYVFIFAACFLFIAFVIFSYQRIKKYKKNRSLFAKEKDELLQSITVTQSPAEISVFDALFELAKTNENAFYTEFKRQYVHYEENMFAKFPDLNENDLVFCAYLRMNFDTKAISRYTHIAVRSVQSKKYRIRKKLNITPEDDLNLFIGSINIL